MDTLDEDDFFKVEKYISEAFNSTSNCPTFKNFDKGEMNIESGLGLRSQLSKIELLEKEIFLLKLRLSHYQTEHNCESSANHLMGLQSQNDVLKSEIHMKQVTIWKAYQLLRNYEALDKCEPNPHSEDVSQYANLLICLQEKLNEYQMHIKLKDHTINLLKDELKSVLSKNAVLEETSQDMGLGVVRDLFQEAN